MNISDWIQTIAVCVAITGVLYNIKRDNKINEENNNRMKQSEKQIQFQQQALENQIKANQDANLIKRAEYSNTFVCNFRELMPDLAFCAHFAEDIYQSDSELKKMYDLLTIDDLDFNTTKYKALLRKNNLDVEKVNRIIGEYKQDGKHILRFVQGHSEENGLGEFSKFHKGYGIYKSIMSDILKSPKEDVDMCNEMTRRYLNSIFAHEQDVYNDFECMALSVKFGLLDMDKLTNLLWAPLFYYIKSMYIRLMQNKIEHEDKGDVVFSNIAELFKSIRDKKIEQNQLLESHNYQKEEQNTVVIENSGDKLV